MHHQELHIFLQLVVHTYHSVETYEGTLFEQERVTPNDRTFVNITETLQMSSLSPSMK